MNNGNDRIAKFLDQDYSVLTPGKTWLGKYAHGKINKFDAVKNDS